MLNKNEVAPTFSALNQDELLISLDAYRDEKNVVLYFYPKDDTPGCTIEANEFTALAGEFAKYHTSVIGVSKDSCDSHLAFAEKYGLNVQLLADTSGEICKSYGVWQEVEKNGEKKMKIVRSTFVINKQGLIKAALYNVSPEGHAQAVLEIVKKLK